jgi:small subunit ribosomal protein S6
MNFYETMYIVHPALQAGRLDDIVDMINTKIDGLKGQRLYIDNWGKKKLSYAIDKQKYGTYILVQFEMGSTGVQELSNEFEHNTNILRYLINRIEKTDILEQKGAPPTDNIVKVEKEKPENNTKDVSEKDNNTTTENTPEDTAEVVAENTSEDTSEVTDENTPEDMSEVTAEDKNTKNDVQEDNNKKSKETEE